MSEDLIHSDDGGKYNRQNDNRAGRRMKRIAMWSGPRNISTAMMRSFENRNDTVVVDEPLYAYYLTTTGLDHPGRADVLAAQSGNWREVVAQLGNTMPPGANVYYQKHMAHHICGDMSLEWAEAFEHGFLLREPKAMLLSLGKVLGHVTLADTGLAQQQKLLRHLHANGATPPVLDSRDVLESPEAALRTLCTAFGLEFDLAMLAWPAGRRDSDGVWAPHWYAAVEASTGFAPYTPSRGELPESMQPLLEQCQNIYDDLYQYRLAIQ